MASPRHMSYKQLMLEADRRYMDYLIKRSRARYAAMSQSDKEQMWRYLQDQAAIAAREIRDTCTVTEAA